MHSQAYALKLQKRIQENLAYATEDYTDEQIIMLRDLAQKNAEAHLADVARYNAILRDREVMRKAAESDEPTLKPGDSGWWESCPEVEF